MKKKIIKLWGVGMIVVLMASLFLIGTTPASAGTLAYSFQAAPGAFNQVAAGTDVALVQVAPNGDIYAVDSFTGTDIYKSTDGGRTWGVLPVTIVGANIVDLKISPSYETDGTVVVLANTATGATVYISENFGATYAALGAQVAALPEVGTCLAISPVYNGGGEIMVGTSDPAAAYGDVYIWGTLAAPYVWTAQLLGGGANSADVMEVAFSSSYQFDFTILAVAATVVGTNLHTKVAAAAWDATVGVGLAAPIMTPTATPITAPGIAPGVTDIWSADIAMPSDFQANAYPTRCVVYIAVRSDYGDDRIYRVLAGSGIGAVAIDPNQVPGKRKGARRRPCWRRIAPNPLRYYDSHMSLISSS